MGGGGVDLPLAQNRGRRRSYKYCPRRGCSPPPAFTLDVVLDHVVYHCLFGEIDLFALEAGLETPSNLLFLGRLPSGFLPSHLIIRTNMNQELNLQLFLQHYLLDRLL